ncbi:MAG TPA: HEAT repeat domain-containing protein [Planctomycetota bacterium]|nr:HEAT repeat domain-containing protein [Planctomycetota bacterium]
MKLLAALLFVFIQDGELDRLLKDLDHDEIERRDRASEALRKLSPESLEIDRRLEAIARDMTAEAGRRADQVRKHRIAARLLTDPERVMERLASPDAGVRRMALQALMPRGGAVVPLIRGHLKDADANVQLVALQIVIAADNPEYLPDVRPFAEHPNLYTQAIPWLASKGDLAAAPPLRAQIERGNTWGIEHLARLRQVEDVRLFRTLMSDHVNYATLVLRSIRGWDEARKLLAREIRLLALDGLAEAILLYPEPRDPEFVSLLKSHRAKDNSAAAYVLAAAGDRDSIPLLMRLVRHRSLNGAIGMLGRLRTREGIWLFRKMLADAKSPEARDRAAYARAAGEIGGPEAEDLLIGLLDDAAEEVRYDAATSLGILKCRRALARLAVLLDDAVLFTRVVPPAAEASLLDHYECRASGVEPRQTRDAAAGAIAAIAGRTREGTLDEQCAAMRAWWEAQGSK